MPPRRTDTINWNDISLQEILSLAIADEEDARDYYRRAAELAGSEQTRRMLLGLSTMEQGHADLLRKELDELEFQRDLETGIAD